MNTFKVEKFGDDYKVNYNGDIIYVNSNMKISNPNVLKNILKINFDESKTLDELIYMNKNTYIGDFLMRMKNAIIDYDKKRSESIRNDNYLEKLFIKNIDLKSLIYIAILILILMIILTVLRLTEHESTIVNPNLSSDMFYK